MTDQNNSTEKVENKEQIAPGAQDASQKQPEQNPNEDLWKNGEKYDAKKADDLIAKLRGQVRDLTPRAKKADEYEKNEQARKEAEMTELQKAQAKAEAAEAKARQLEIEKLQLSTATKLGLPVVFADRLRGETLEEMEADATKILESLPKQQGEQQKKPSPGAITNPGVNGGTQETREQKKARLMGTPPDIWAGAGINWVENPKE